MLENLAVWDIAFMLLYFILLMVVGFYFSRNQDSSTEYFLAGRKAGWVVIGASLFASNISRGDVIGLASGGAFCGLVMGNSEGLACLVVLMLAWLFVPFYLKAGVFTMPEFLERRYNKSSRIYLTTISIIAYVLTRISVILFAGGLLLHEILGWDIAMSAMVVVMVAGIYTVAGGLKTIVHVDVLQASVFIFGIAILTIFRLNEIGSLSSLQSKVTSTFFSVSKPLSDTNFPGIGIILGAPILGIWYWCTDQYVVQRVLGAKSINHARSGVILAGFLNLLPVFILVLSGVIACSWFNEPNKAYPMLVARGFLPTGIKGIVGVSLLAVSVSSLASCLNSSSTLFTMDFYRHFHPRANERELVLVGRLTTTALVILGILWVPFIRYISSQIYVYLQNILAYISPPITAVFMMGILWDRVNGKGAIWTLITGTLIGALRFIVELLHKAGHMSLPILQKIAEVNFLHFAVFLFLLSTGVLVTVSVITEPSTRKKITGLTFSTANEVPIEYTQDKNLSWTETNIIFSILLIVIVITLFINGGVL